MPPCPPSNPTASIITDVWSTEVYIDGQGPFQFLIDTASSRSLIFEHVRKRLDLAQSQPGRMTVYGINDVAKVMPVKPRELRFAGESISGLTMGVLPDTEYSDPDGILGVDVLSRYFVVLDRGTMRIKLLPPGVSSARALWRLVGSGIAAAHPEEISHSILVSQGAIQRSDNHLLVRLGRRPDAVELGRGRAAGRAQIPLYGLRPAPGHAAGRVGQGSTGDPRRWAGSPAAWQNPGAGSPPSSPTRRSFPISTWTKSLLPLSDWTCCATTRWRSISRDSGCTWGQP